MLAGKDLIATGPSVDGSTRGAEGRCLALAGC
jgi:hypothetical protein